MSKTVDERVVSMQFDNKNFEKNVATSMSTLDKLKAALHLDGATKGMENVQKASDKMDFSKCEFAATRAGFHIQDVFEKATRFLEDNIARRIVDVGKKIVNEFTVAPISSGFEEYELKMGSVQTIMASTGEELATVNKYLEELNKYSDKTIYSFSDMTNNIGKFTNAGVKLEDAVSAIKGISNEAAVSGANAEEASRAMYNFSQALSAGYVKLIDWKSIENANMATVEFKDTLLETALALGTVVKQGDMYQSVTTDNNGNVSDLFNTTMGFNDALSSQWMTTEVLTQALSIYANDVREMTEVEKELYEEKLKGLGYTDDQISKFEELGMKAYDSAQDVKTFSMMMDTLKEAAQSGWAQTWELIFGDFEEAKSLWTELSTTFGAMIDESSQARNDFLSDALSSNWKKFSNILSDTGVDVEDFALELKKTAKEQGVNIDALTKEYGSLINVIMSGELDSSLYVKTLDKMAESEKSVALQSGGATAKLKAFEDVINSINTGAAVTEKDIAKALIDAGYEYKDVQTLVTKVMKGQKLVIEDLTEAELAGIKCTSADIGVLQKLADQARETGTPLRELIDDMYRPSGRELLIESLRNVLSSIKGIMDAVGKAWHNVFGEADSEVLYNLIQRLFEFTEKLKLTEKRADQITRIFQGLFSILDAIKMVVGGGLRIAFKVLGKVLGTTNIDVLELLAKVGDAITSFKNWLFETNNLSGALEKLGGIFSAVIAYVKGLIDKFLELPIVKETIKFLQGALSTFFKELGAHFEGGGEVIGEFIDRVKAMDGISLDNIGKVIKDFRDNVIGHFLDVDGAFDGTNEYIATFMERVRSTTDFASTALSNFYDLVVRIFTRFKERLTNLDLGSVISIALGAGSIMALKGVADFISGIHRVLNIAMDLADGLTGILEGVQNVLNSVAKTIGSVGKYVQAKSIETLAVAIAILVGAIVVLAFIPTEKLWPALKALGILVGIVAALMLVMSATAKLAGTTAKASIGIAGVGVCLLLMAFALKIIGDMDPDALKQGVLVLGGFLALMLIFTGVAAFAKTSSEKTKAMSKFVQQLSKAMLRIAIFAAICAFIPPEGLGKGALILLGFGGVVTGLVFLSKAIKDAEKTIDPLIKLMKKLTNTMLLISVFCAIVTLIPWESLGKAGSIIGVFTVVISALVFMSKLATVEQIEKVSALLTATSTAMLIMSAACIVAGKIQNEGFNNAILVAAGMLAIMKLLLVMTQNYSTGDMKNAGTLLISFSASMLIMSAAIAAMSILDPNGLWNAVGAILIVSIAMSLLITVSKQGKISKNLPAVLTTLTICIAAIAVAVAALSMLDSIAMIGSTLAIMGIIVALTMLMVGLSTITSSKAISGKTIAVLGILTGIISVIGGVILGLSSMKDPNSVIASAAALSLVMLSLVAVCMAVSTLSGPAKKAVGGIGIVLAVSTSLALVVESLVALSTMNIDDLEWKMGALALVIGGLVAVCVVISKNSASFSKALPGMAVLVGIAMALSVVMLTLSSITVDSNQLIFLAEVLGIFAIGLIAVSVAATLLQATGATFALQGLATTFGLFAAAGVMFAASVFIIIESLNMLSLITGEQVKRITASILNLLEMFITIIPQIGAAMLVLITTIYTVLINAIPLIVETLVVMATNILLGMMQIVPLLIEGIVLTITKLIMVLTENFPVIVDCILTMIFDLLTAIRDNLGKIVIMYVDTILNVIAAIQEKLPEIRQAAIDFLLAFIEGLGQGIEDNAEKFRDTIISLCEHIWNAFCTFFEIHSPSKKMAEAGGFLINGLINGITGLVGAVGSAILGVGKKIISGIGSFASSALSKGKELMGKLKDGISSKVSDVVSKAKNVASKVMDGMGNAFKKMKEIGENLMDGLKSGISGAVGKVTDAVGGVCDSIIGGAKSLFGIHSPSRVFKEIGRYCDEGLAVGLEQYSKLAERSADDVGNKTINSISEAISQITDDIGDVDTQPVIRPVLDLSNIQNGQSQLYRMMDQMDGYALNGSTNLASSLNLDRVRLNNQEDLSSAVDMLKNTVRDLANRPTEVTNNFDIQGDDPVQIANEVSRILQQQVERRDAVWG